MIQTAWAGTDLPKSGGCKGKKVGGVNTPNTPRFRHPCSGGFGVEVQNRSMYGTNEPKRKCAVLSCVELSRDEKRKRPEHVYAYPVYSIQLYQIIP